MVEIPKETLEGFCNDAEERKQALLICIENLQNTILEIQKEISKIDMVCMRANLFKK